MIILKSFPSIKLSMISVSCEDWNQVVVSTAKTRLNPARSKISSVMALAGEEVDSKGNF